MCRLAVAQKATVTFYSPPDPLSHQVKEGVSWWGTSPFRGFIFNGNKQLAHLSAGNFITFEFPVGKYVFSATPHKSPTDKYTINIEANAGEHYYVRLVMKWKGVSPVYFVDPQLETVDCATATKESIGTSPLEAEHVSKDSQTFVVQTASSLSCP